MGVAWADYMKLTLIDRLREGCVIPAHPLALSTTRRLDTRRQRALSRYYLDAGVGGMAVGVHTTQFAIHDPQVGLYEPVLTLAAEASHAHVASGGHEPILVAGILGPREQAIREAATAKELGYHLGLLSLAALAGESNRAIVDFVREISEIIPVMAFYLPPALSGMILDYGLWRDLLEIRELLAIKIAPFDRYGTLDVLEAVAESGRSQEVALYTGNDDTIVQDLLTPYCFNVRGERVRLRIVGGLLGQWACWTRRAVSMLERIRTLREMDTAIPADILTLGAQLTLANRAIFDAQHSFNGCIPGISYVLHGQGLLESTVSLSSDEHLSDGQAAAIDHIIEHYAHLTDNDFVSEHIAKWLAP